MTMRRNLDHDFGELRQTAAKRLKQANARTAGIWAAVLAVLGLVVYYARTALAHPAAGQAPAGVAGEGHDAQRQSDTPAPASNGGGDGQSWRPKPADASDNLAEAHPKRGGAHQAGRPQTKNPEPGGGHDEFAHDNLPVIKERKQWRERTWNKAYWGTLIMGALMVIFPWLLGYTTDIYASLSSIILGAIVLIISVVGLLLRGRGTWEYWIIGMAGMLVFVAPFVFGFEMLTGGLWAFLILGILITVFAGSEAFDIRVRFP